jgi:hypothetical protein
MDRSFVLMEVLHSNFLLIEHTIQEFSMFRAYKMDCFFLFSTDPQKENLL